VSGQILRLGFLASRKGTSLRAIVRAISNGELSAQALIVVSNNRNAEALDFARGQGIETRHIPTQSDPQAADSELARTLAAAGVELVVLCGYLRHLGPETLSRFHNRIVNIHPSLLPEFGGEGMYGRQVHEAVISAKAMRSGATVHLVDEVYDRGAILAQRSIDLVANETAESLEAKVTALEPDLFVETLRKIATGEMVLPG
jgi:phosphoribosylglycinamide formyltransferase 1